MSLFGRRLPVLIFILLLAAILLHYFVFSIYSAPSDLMSPTIHKHDYFVVSKLDHKFGRGDVVVYKTDGAEESAHVRRIIGLPGDQISLRNNTVYINNGVVGLKLTGSSGEKSLTELIEILPGGREHRILRVNMCCEHKENKNKSFLVQAGHYLVLADNRRDLYEDSDRSDIIEPAERDIIGKATMIVWHGNTHKIDYQPIQ